MSDDWGDIPDETRMERRAAAASAASVRRTQGLSREQRFINTLAVVSALTLVVGVGIGFWLGRSSAPKTSAAPIIEASGTVSVETSETSLRRRPEIAVTALQHRPDPVIRQALVVLPRTLPKFVTDLLGTERPLRPRAAGQPAAHGPHHGIC